jgi:hypothetical protein
MDKLFKEMVSIKDVRGVLLITDTGEIRYQNIVDGGSSRPESVDWLSLFNCLAGMSEAELVGERLRFYIRKCEGGYLVVLMSPIASPSMVRLNCDLVLPALKEADGAKGLRRFFKR